MSRSVLNLTCEELLRELGRRPYFVTEEGADVPKAVSNLVDEIDILRDEVKSCRPQRGDGELEIHCPGCDC